MKNILLSVTTERGDWFSATNQHQANNKSQISAKLSHQLTPKHLMQCTCMSPDAGGTQEKKWVNKPQKEVLLVRVLVACEATVYFQPTSGSWNRFDSSGTTAEKSSFYVLFHHSARRAKRERATGFSQLKPGRMLLHLEYKNFCSYGCPKQCKMCVPVLRC